jgi:hypothetical protein
MLFFFYYWYIDVHEILKLPSERKTGVSLSEITLHDITVHAKVINIENII